MQFCAFYKKQSLALGIIQTIHKKKVEIIEATKKESSILYPQIICSWEDQQNNIQETIPELLNTTLERAKSYAEEIELKMIYELCDFNQNYDLEELSQSFLSLDQEPWQKLSLFLALENELYLFRKKKKYYIKRSPEEIDQFKKIKAREKLLNEKKIKEKQWFENLLRKKQLDIGQQDQDDWKHFKERLLHFAIHLEQHAEADYFYSLINQTSTNQISIDRKLADILKASWC